MALEGRLGANVYNRDRNRCVGANRARMENCYQDHLERCSNFCGLFIQLQGHGMWPWTCWGQRKRGHWPLPSPVIEVTETMYKYCKHILKFSNCVLLRVSTNNNNYEQLIALFVIILAKNPSWINMVTGVIYCWRQVGVMVTTSIIKSWR